MLLKLEEFIFFFLLTVKYIYINIPLAEIYCQSVSKLTYAVSYYWPFDLPTCLSIPVGFIKLEYIHRGVSYKQNYTKKKSLFKTLNIEFKIKF